MSDHLDDVTDLEARRANRRDWDDEADEYQAEHGEFLGDADLVWSPEGYREADVRWLVSDPSELAGRVVVEVGCGAAQASRWLADAGAHAVGVDLSWRMLQHAARIDDARGRATPVAQADAVELPLRAGCADFVVSAFGALPFIVDIDSAFREMARILRPGARMVVAVTHPMRRMFPDDPTSEGLTVIRSYFDRRSYVEHGDDGTLAYAEPHHTLEDWVAAVTGAGLRLRSLREPTWPAGHERTWGGWGPDRGALMPGTLVIDAEREPGADAGGT